LRGGPSGGTLELKRQSATPKFNNRILIRFGL